MVKLDSNADIKLLAEFERQQRELFESKVKEQNEYVSKVEKDFGEMLKGEEAGLVQAMESKLGLAQRRAEEEIIKQKAEFEKHKKTLESMYLSRIEVAVNKVADSYFE